MHRLLALLLCSLTSASTAMAAPVACAKGPAIPLTGKSCDPLTPPRLSCTVPMDVQGGLSQANYNTVQRASDLFSWQQFIALNWPAAAGKRGVPAADQLLGATGPRVWETWKEAYEVYLPDGGKPPEWNAPQVFPAACGATGKLLLRTAKVSDVVDETLQALPATARFPASLKDQKGRLVRYEIRLNETAFQYIAGERNKLYNGEQQTQATSIGFPVGSQLVKAAWRELDSGDAGYFLATEACVCEDTGVDTPENCQVKPMGLAGFHLMTKTASAPQWIWSTFEQVDNVIAIHPSVKPLNNPACPPDKCPPNKQTPDGVPTQLTRVIPIPDQDPVCGQRGQAVDNVVQLNADVKAALSKASPVLANYHLINTQWPVKDAKQQGMTAFKVFPALLGNTTMESFAQDTSSCMGCHAMSRTLKPDLFISADFSFTLNNAQPRPKGARCVDVEASLSCSDNILGPPAKHLPPSPEYARVLHGYAVTTRTYEMLGSKYVGNKLHCESCHLNGGGNPTAAWWPGVEQRQKGRTGLQQRINQCFEHSMNGNALCQVGKDCDSNPDMNGLIAYMNWLTEQYKSKHQGQSPTISGFPQPGRPRQAVSIKRGGEVYTQKCAFCHNADGQGRYEDGYFRPALWGDNSYNRCAGLHDDTKLSAFLYGNMPYTSGGLLTVQEAWDLATFINSQPRPACP